MSPGSGVPPVLRPVLEELRGFADAAWRGLASQDRVTAAWAGAMRDAITAALASDAGTAEGEPFFHRLGCPQISGRGTAAHGTCPPDRERPDQTPPGVAEVAALTLDVPVEQVRYPEPSVTAETTPTGGPVSYGTTAPPTHAPETSTSLVDAAPDAELERLLNNYCMTIEGGGPYPRGGLAGMRAARAAIHAHVERVKRDAYDDGHRAGARIMSQVHGGSHMESLARVPRKLRCPSGWHVRAEEPCDCVAPPDSVLRREKEEG